MLRNHRRKGSLTIVATIRVNSADSQATLPGAYTFTTADQGVHTFTSQFILRTTRHSMDSHLKQFMAIPLLARLGRLSN